MESGVDLAWRSFKRRSDDYGLASDLVKVMSRNPNDKALTIYISADLRTLVKAYTLALEVNPQDVESRQSLYRLLPLYVDTLKLHIGNENYWRPVDAIVNSLTEKPPEHLEALLDCSMYTRHEPDTRLSMNVKRIFGNASGIPAEYMTAASIIRHDDKDNENIAAINRLMSRCSEEYVILSSKHNLNGVMDQRQSYHTPKTLIIKSMKGSPRLRGTIIICRDLLIDDELDITDGHIFANTISGDLYGVLQNNSIVACREIKGFVNVDSIYAVENVANTEGHGGLIMRNSTPVVKLTPIRRGLISEARAIGKSLGSGKDKF